MKLKFSGNRALILGGSCALAIDLAESMIHLGFQVVLTARNKKSRNKIDESLHQYDGKYVVQHLDFEDTDSSETLFKKINNDLDYMVDFVQGDYERLMASANANDIHRYFQANISFRAEILKRAGRAMLRKKRGRLVFISSSAAQKPNPGQGFYSAAKLASEALYRNMGIELGDKGITTVSIRPGYIESGRGKTYLEMEKNEALNKVPIRRALMKNEITETILFFLSDSAQGFNATEINMDGGLTAGK